MVLEKPQLFLTRRDLLLFFLFMLSLIAVRLFFFYQSYQDFISKPFYYTTAKVLNTYPKTREGKSYQILKLQSREGLLFFTESYRKKDLRGEHIRIELYPSARIGFPEYLGSFYVKSRIKQILPSVTTVKKSLMTGVAAQHRDPEIASFYQAIFFATPLPKALREKIAALGVSHLVALSGFHLGILWSVIYGILLFLYRPFQKRYFPYRFSLINIGMVTILVLGFYVWFVGAPPSLLRSYAMVLVGWIVILLGMDLLRFTFLATIGLTLLLLFPSLLVSLSFWLSIAGVFYIFLILQYTKGINGWIVSLLIIPVGIFLLMLPLVHTIFGLTTPYQLLSPLLSVLFIPFYPLVILLHLLGMGGLLDEGLVRLFSLSAEGREVLLPVWAALIYISVSLLAIRYKWAFALLLSMAGMYSVYLFWYKVC